ncbi:hypothetical protein KY363_05535 [Candidatus Woesearchaeota archaeon]|nr:hypothetical protein [Candidatus Woesearchaeota archaeon]
MKKQALLVIFAALLVLAAIPAQAAIRPNVIVTGFKVVKGTAEVGKEFTLRLTITNLEPAACANRLTATVQANAPFILDGLNTFSAADLCKGASTTVDVPMKIDPTATGGFYQLTVAMNYETVTLSQFSSSSTINLFVEGSPEINAYITGSEPVDVYPGDTATVTVTVQNDGDFEAQSATAGVRANAPLEAKWSKSLSSLGMLDAKQSKTAEFTIEVPKDAASGDYPLEMGVRYLDENLDQQTRYFNFTFHVSEKAMFSTSDAGSDALYADENANMVRIDLNNIGTDAARKVKVKVLPQFPFSTDGSLRYIEMLEPGKSAPVEFKIDVDKDATIGTYSIDLLLDYEDAQGKTFQDTTNLALRVEPKGLFKAVVADYWFIWVLVLVIAGIITLKRMKAAKKNGNGNGNGKKRK